MAKQIGISQAAEDAVNIIATAADKATKSIAAAALDATKLLASNATEAARVIHQKDSEHGSDHDLLTKLEVKMDSLKADIKDLKDGTASKIVNLQKDKADQSDFDELKKLMVLE